MKNTSPSPHQFLPLTATEFHIMLVLAGQSLHGYGIMQQIETETDGTIKLGVGTLYTTIKRLLERSWIEEIEAPVDAEDPRRKYYILTTFGERVVTAEAKRLSNLVHIARDLGLIGDVK